MITERPSKSEIFSQFNKMRAQLRREGDEKGIERLNKALGIVMSRDYYQGERFDYHPSAYSCGCKDWQFRYARRRGYAGPCKHMLAEMMIRAIMENRTAAFELCVPAVSR